MRLYTNNQGEWVGTQDEARRQFGKDFAMVEVPTSKEALMKWLNNCMVVSQAHQQAAVASGAQAAPTSTSMKPHAWQTIRECAERAPLKDLGAALAVAMNRLDEIADRNG